MQAPTVVEIDHVVSHVANGLAVVGILAAPDSLHFLKSHGVRTPDAFWKVVIRGVGQSQKAIAWIVPNSKAAKQDRLDQYLVSVAEIERVTGEKMPLVEGVKQVKLTHSWAMPKGCDKG
jgi:endonuclease G